MLASTNPARYHGLDQLGSLGPGHQADVLAFDGLVTWVPARVWQAGRCVAMGGSIVPGAVPAAPVPALLRDTVNIGALPQRLNSSCSICRPVRRSGPSASPATASRLVTRSVTLGSDDVAHAAVVERHRATGRIGLGFVTGFGLRRGAIASTVAHDAHNVVCVGASGADMAVAVARLAELGGGQLAVLDGDVVAELPLPLAGLMSDRGAVEVADQQHALRDAAARVLGVTLEEPFMQLSFIALSVIPQLRITDGGTLDVDGQRYVPAQIA